MDGQLLAGRYEILALIGVGGMGSVYKAKDTELDEVVALKVLRRELVNAPGMLARFRQEAKLARRVTHPNVARTFDIGEHDGDKFLTMEFVDGRPLADLLASRGRLDLAQTVAIAGPVCEGLRAAHAAGVVHRDLKPDNVLVAKDGRIAITDFGIARALGGGDKGTMGRPIGTPAYMAPEQVEGAPDVDARADIYALGAMLFELLVGEAPWSGESVYAIAVARLLKPPPDPRARRPDIPDAAARVVMKCMARKKEERYASVDEVIDALASVTLPAGALDGAPVRVSLRAPPAEAPTKSVAVLPLQNLGAPDDAYLADGLTDDLIDSLSMTPGLRVRSRGAVGHFRGAARDPRELGRELGVQVVVEGSLRKTDDALQIRARVLSVDDGFQLWAKRFDRAASEILAVGEEVARAVAVALTLDQSTPAAPTPLDAETVELYLRARHRYQAGWSEAAKEAADLFERALVRAPENPMLLSGYALALARYNSLNDHDASAVEATIALAKRAVAAAPRLAVTRIALARLELELGDAAACARELAAAAPFADEEGEFHAEWGRLLAESGRLDDGVMRLERALRLEPRLQFARIDFARAHALLGNYDAAEAALGARTQAAGLAVNQYWLPRARFLTWRGDKARARKCLAELEAAPRENRTWGGRVIDVVRMTLADEVDEGLLDRALAVARGNVRRVPRRESFTCQLLAETAARARKTECVLDFLEAADRAMLLDVAWMDHCPLFAAARAEPRFQAVHAHVQARASEVLGILGAAGSRAA